MTMPDEYYEAVSKNEKLAKEEKEKQIKQDIDLLNELSQNYENAKDAVQQAGQNYANSVLQINYNMGGQAQNYINTQLALINTQNEFIKTLAKYVISDVEQLKNYTDEVLENAKNAKEISTNAVKIAQGAADISPAAEKQTHFQKTADDLNSSVRIWLGITIVSFIITFFWLSLFVFSSEFLPDWLYKSIQRPVANSTELDVAFFSSKIITTFLLATITFWASRMYKYYLNLRRVYLDKVVLIKTYISYLKLTPDEGTKKLLREKIIEVIFSQINLSAPGMATSDATKILEVINKK